MEIKPDDYQRLSVFDLSSLVLPHFLLASPVSKHVIQIIVTSAVNECGFVARAGRGHRVVYSGVRGPSVFTHRNDYVTVSGD